ncbi:FAD-dependent catabolic D-arginine dehydrogenase DauA [Methylacidimicrobium sp. AP8]|uniref:NAD(P)/FAD-dependent oxidoreductase n=1 Tax=Methylacidimicrobium sp. AP8 TaxID=2730359 RepID=UPI0018C1B39E|nr:FAD-binding oxidoreductase [Methylacidimicrobium sp. AP8]CAB4243167.1 FAD-dependent catabolic D-arginine dehydrogenase DauA [Methylacidimicrobium sp. AP8]
MDVLVIGGGIAGFTTAYHLAGKGRSVLLLERETRPAYHSTGRSAVFFRGSHGVARVRALCRASRPFFADPPRTLPERRLASPRDALFICSSADLPALEAFVQGARESGTPIERLAPEEACARVPVLRPEYVGGAALETGGMDIHLPALLATLQEGILARGGRIELGAEVREIERKDGLWRVRTSACDYSAPLLVNAAGAWSDRIARLAGARPIGLVPKRRTVMTFRPDPAAGIARWPMVLEVRERFYFRPWGEELLASPADQTPVPPCDAQPEEADCRLLLQRLAEATTLPLGPASRLRRWAGLRSFVPDERPVLGWDPDLPGFFWVAALGGFGIETSPAVGEVAAALLTGEPFPPHVAAEGVCAADFSPERLRIQKNAGG